MRAALTRRMKLLEEAKEVHSSEVQSSHGIFKDKKTLKKHCNPKKN